MNRRLIHLRELMATRFGRGPDQLQDALYLLRAHHDLAGIVLCCKRLSELLGSHGFLRNAEDLPDYDQQLSVLDEIAQLDDVDPHYLSGTIQRNVEKETPLVPYTGDSGICDTLLLLPGSTAGPAQRKDYEWLQAWFAWQIFHFQHRVESRERFDAYLGSESKPAVRLREGHGSRVYGVFLFLRKFADPAHAAIGRTLVNWLGEATDRSSVIRAHVLGEVCGSRGADAQWRSRLLKFGLSAEEIADLELQARTLSDMLSATDASGLSAVSLFLQSIWLSPSADRRRNLDAIHRRLRREANHLDVERYGDLLAVPNRVEGPGSEKGILVDLHWEPPSRSGDSDGSVPVQDVDSEDQPTEPEIQLFLGDGNPVASWYAAKSAGHRVEAHNALLRWPNWRLSETAIKRLREVIETHRPDDLPASLHARLALGISLVTGRHLSVASPVLIGEGEPPEDLLSITVTDHVLHLPVARPKLKKATFSTDPLPEFCLPWASTVRLRLPNAWRPLVKRVHSASAVRPKTIAVECERLLAAIHEELGVTPKAIAGCMQLALLQRGRDDLALVKMLTDSSDINFDNLIHYASYPRTRVESSWRWIVSKWIKRLPPVLAQPEGEDVHVGAPFPLDARKIAKAIEEVKALFQRTVSSEDRQDKWRTLHNLLTIYVSLWIGLATAGRRTRDPIPPIIGDDGWALIRDKHRPDESTDRYIPLGESLRAQIEVLRGLTEALGIFDPALEAAREGATEGLSLRIFSSNGKSVPFQPLHWDEVDSLRALPRNWGRRLVRSNAPELVGRLKDAGMGHWVRGRHPWSWTSTFPSDEFRRQWTALQARLESSLGFEVLNIPELGKAGLGTTIFPPAPIQTAHQDSKASALSEEDIDGLLRLSSKQGEYEAIFEASPPLPQVARWLVSRAMALRAEGEGALLIQDAEAICRFIRKKTRIPIFAMRPRARFQKNWMTSSTDLQAWTYIQRCLLPRIVADLKSLPLVEDSADVRIGRVIVAAALRASVLSGRHLAALLDFLQSDRPIEAVREAWMIQLDVRSKRADERMRRTLLLEPYLGALLVVERDALRGDRLKACSFTWASEQRNVCFHAYLNQLGLPKELSLTRFLGGLRQHLMLSGSPILAAYASGEILTHDLPVAEFRRLAGLEPQLPLLDGPEESEDAQLQTAADGSTEWPSNAAESLDVMPDDLVDKGVNLVTRLATPESLSRDDWRSSIRDELKETDSAAARLLREFAIELIDTDSTGSEGRPQFEASDRLRQNIKRNLEIVWAGISRFIHDGDALKKLDSDGLRVLMALSADHFRARAHRAAWSRFHRFLQERRSVASGEGGVDDLEFPDGFVSAKILSSEEMARIRQLLGSVQSGVGTADNRQAAVVHFELAGAVGARRAEIEWLRWVDIDGNLVRVRPYPGRSLKTPASNRVLPLLLLDQERWHQLSGRRTEGHRMVLEAAAGKSVLAANYYDSLARAMKKATGDPEVGMHHLRHTKASLLALRMLDNAVSLDHLGIDLPWLLPSLPPPAEVELLLRSAKQAGQGMKAISVLLGHQHETTTLHHYVHTLGVALHAYHLGLAHIDLPGAFRRRIPGGSSMYRHARRYEENGLSQAEMDRRLRDDLVVLATRRRKRRPSKGQGEKDVLLVRQHNVPLRLLPDAPLDEVRLDEAQQALDDFEFLQKCITEGRQGADDRLDSVRLRLHELAALPSGKRGAMTRRHPMPERGPDETPLPKPLLPGLPVTYARILLAWLLRLQRETPADFHWLVDRWKHASHSETGAIRLSQKGDLDRARALLVDPLIQLGIKPIQDTASRQQNGRPDRYQLLIGFSPSVLTLPAGKEGKKPWRTAGAVRWVLTWAAVTFDSI